MATLVPSGGLPAVAGATRRSAGPGDGAPGDLGGAVEVVEDLAEGVHHPAASGPGSAEPLLTMVRMLEVS